MGILNVTPDSFSDGGLHESLKSAVAAGVQMAEAGAGCIDIGGESTRPGYSPIALEVELSRVMPVVRELKKELGNQVVLSIDTTKTPVAHQALDAGVAIINDVSGMRDLPGICGLLKRYSCGYVLVHSGGEMPDADELLSWYKAKVVVACQEESGISSKQFILDGGIGFHTGWQDDIKAMKMVPLLKQAGAVVLVGASKKSFLGQITGRQLSDRLAGSVSLVALGRQMGADIFRVHDVAPSLDACRVADVLGDGNGENYSVCQ